MRYRGIVFIVETSYTITNYDAISENDHVIESVVGRNADYSGAGFGVRDLGWYCQSEIEAARIKKALAAIGLQAKVSNGSR